MADRKSQYDVGFDKNRTRMKFSFEITDPRPENMDLDELNAWEHREINRIEPFVDRYNLLYKEMLAIKDKIGSEWLFMLNDHHNEYYLKRKHPLHKGKDFLYYPVSWDIRNSRNP